LASDVLSATSKGGPPQIRVTCSLVRTTTKTATSNTTTAMTTGMAATSRADLRFSLAAAKQTCRTQDNESSCARVRLLCTRLVGRGRPQPVPVADRDGVVGVLRKCEAPRTRSLHVRAWLVLSAPHAPVCDSGTARPFQHLRGWLAL